MRTNSHTFSTLLLWAITAVVLGCANTPDPNPSAVYVPSISTLQPEEYPGEIEKYHQLIQSDLHLGVQQRAHLYLASLYFSPMNPNRDYKLALKHLETYALYDPDFVNGVDPRLLRALNQEAEMLKIQASASRGSNYDTHKANQKLKRRIGRLQKKIRNLENSNAQLNKTIEMLSKLDSRLEEKRSNFIKMDSGEKE
jgi:hypothetical protein